jgi:gliotoxin/aspirochlorine biosynthesis thioredoxin reductase
LTIPRFHCLFCHGYEERGAPSAGVLATDDSAPSHMALHLARFANRLASKITIYTNGNEAVTKGVQELLSKEKPNSKAAKNIVVESRKIAKFVKGTQKVEIEVVLEDGTKKVERFLAHKPKGQLNGDWVNQLGLETTEQGDIKVSPPFNETSVSGVFAAGDCGTVMKAVPLAIGMGSTIVAGLAMQLAGED